MRGIVTILFLLTTVVKVFSQHLEDYYKFQSYSFIEPELIKKAGLAEDVVLANSENEVLLFSTSPQILNDSIRYLVFSVKEKKSKIFALPFLTIEEGSAGFITAAYVQDSILILNNENYVLIYKKTEAGYSLIDTCVWRIPPQSISVYNREILLTGTFHTSPMSTNGTSMAVISQREGKYSVTRDTLIKVDLIEFAHFNPSKWNCTDKGLFYYFQPFEGTVNILDPNFQLLRKFQVTKSIIGIDTAWLNSLRKTVPRNQAKRWIDSLMTINYSLEYKLETIHCDNGILTCEYSKKDSANVTKRYASIYAIRNHKEQIIVEAAFDDYQRDYSMYNPYTKVLLWRSFYASHNEHMVVARKCADTNYLERDPFKVKEHEKKYYAKASPGLCLFFFSRPAGQ